MKNYVALKTKFYKNSNAKGELGHVNRVFNENKNAFPEHTKNNFGTENLFERYNEIYDRVNERKAELKLKRLNKSSNTFIDSVAIFSLEQWEELEKKFNPEEIKNLITERMNDFMTKFKNEFGFEPVGFNMHLDEGHEKNQLIRNVHAHVIFFNYDFKKDKAPLRKITKKHTAKMQDLLAESFSDLGFQRGVSKEISNKKGLEKEQYIEKKLNEREEKIKDLENKIKSINKKGRVKQQKLLNLEVEKELLEEYTENLKEEVKEAENRLKKIKNLTSSIFKKALTITKNYISNFYKNNDQDYKKDIDSYSKVIIDYEQFDKIESEKVEKEINENLFNNDKKILNDIRKSKNKLKPKNSIN